ncbi:MAG: 50S ribosomal protein L10 [Proteobacteria bacterium]|nr:50S ribosomal protein L10 [Pseudomonadota bacterium]
MDIKQKKEIVTSLHEDLKRSKIVIATDFKGLDVASVTQLRSELTKENIDYRVIKNTLLRRASEDTDVALLRDLFKGPSAIAISYDDPVSPAKILTKFSEANNKLEIKGAVMEGRLLDINGIKALSSLPSREVLLGQLLATMNAVPTGIVQVLAAVPRGFLNALQAIKEQKEAA